MGLDGFSMSNLGLNRNLSSAQLANEAEATARQSLDSQIADADGVGKREKVGKKDEDAAFNGTIPFIAEPKEEDKNEQSEQEQSQEPAKSAPEQNETDDEDPERYHFRFNEENQIEVFDAEKKAVVRTISPEEASKVFHNFSKVPGIFINKQI